jgi:transcriptional regulator with XRE-family HTH domain
MLPSSDLAELYIELGKHITLARQRKGMSIKQLSRACGVSFSTISRIELGQQTPQLALLFTLFYHLEIEMVLRQYNDNESLASELAATA